MLIHFLTFCHYPLTNACTCFYLLLWATRWQCGLWNASAATTAWHSNFYCSFSNSLLTHVRICRSQCWAACNEAMFTERSITGGLVYIKQQRDAETKAVPTECPQNLDQTRWVGLCSLVPRVPVSSEPAWGSLASLHELSVKSSPHPSSLGPQRSQHGDGEGERNPKVCFWFSVFIL